MAGKTGTAQVADKGIKYSDGVYQGSFVGFFPADKPKYTICVVIRTKPHSGAYYGGTIAAPVFRMVADKIFANNMGSWDGPLDSIGRVEQGRMIGRKATANSYETLLSAVGKKMPVQAAPTGMVQLSMDSAKKVTMQQQPVWLGVMPDVKGMGLRDAVYLLEHQGVRVDVQGRGKVQAQSVAPGTRIAKGQNIIIQLS